MARRLFPLRLGNRTYIVLRSARIGSLVCHDKSVYMENARRNLLGCDQIDRTQPITRGKHTRSQDFISSESNSVSIGIYSPCAIEILPKPVYMPTQMCAGVLVEVIGDSNELTWIETGR